MSDASADSVPSFETPVDVLLVDDDEVWVRSTARLLEHAVDAVRVETATSLAAGHDRYAVTDPDCVVCDYQLGDGTGFALLETVREADPDCPFILVTGRGDEHVASEATRKGVTEYVVKHDGGANLLATRVATVVDSARTRRALERERDAKNALLELLTTTSDETTLCQEFCSLLVEGHGYACAWVGTEREDGEIVVQASAGADGFLETVLHGGDSAPDPTDPAVAARDADEPVVRSPSPSADDERSWHAIATDYGFETAAGVPVRHDGVRFGVLGVYASDGPAFDDRRRHLLAEFGETIGYAFHSAEFRRSLLSEQPVRVGIELTEGSTSLLALWRALPAESRLLVRSVVRRRDGDLLCLTAVEGTTESALVDAVGETDGITVADGGESVRGRGSDDPLYCALFLNGDTPLSQVLDTDGAVLEALVEGNAMELHVQLPDHESVSTLETALESTGGDATITSLRQDRRSDASERIDHVLEPLTDKQEDAIRHAYYQGFFEHPRDTTATELAEQFGVTRQTITHHLRAAERKLLNGLLEE
ncbi:response regulator [Salinadaptatus halalkaliphilus]|uniref:Response regulator n=1 Tax=Salinadaptatus halalkaliphilus TaxID=2419781 RepID=A0A4S3TKW4_9EURY|nr:helix-turn-helix domain-containing protein [Salinadaptatus halalkaliphilus]THE64686.1 response regulator [Salinadaptatus halalkaliphilus]